MHLKILFGILLPFIGTTLGAAAVFFSQNKSKKSASGCLSGFSAGVMIASSVWSLIIPAVEMSQGFGFFSFFPMLLGLWLGVVFLVLSEKAAAKLLKKDDSGTFLFFFAVVLHNIPEGMAVGIAFALALAEESPLLLISALMLSIGMTLQNIPEGAIISLPLAERGKTKSGSFLLGSLSGIVEPVAAFCAILFSSVASTLLPYLLGFAAGAMIYVSAAELIPKAAGIKGTLCFLLGFSVMMVLDVALG